MRLCLVLLLVSVVLTKHNNLGPAAINIFDPSKWGNQQDGHAPGSNITENITLEIARICIALSVFSVGVEVCHIHGVINISVAKKICLAPLEIDLHVSRTDHVLGLDDYSSFDLGSYSGI